MDQSTGPTEQVPVKELSVRGMPQMPSIGATWFLLSEAIESRPHDPTSPQSWNEWLAGVQVHPDWDVIVGSVWAHAQGWTTIVHFSYRTRESRTEEHAERDLNTQAAIVFYANHPIPMREWLGAVVDHMANVYRHEMEEYLLVKGQRVLDPHKQQTARRDPLGL